MIPVTYPSSVSTSKESQMVVFALPSVAGLQRWTDYIPVKLQSTGSDIANSFNTNGYLACDFLQGTTGKQAWIDYIPVYVDNAATVAWQVSDTGYIPFNTLPGGGLYYLGPSLDLNFVGSLSNPLFATTAEDYTLNTNFLSLFYQVEAQYSVQGTNGIEQKNFADIVTFTRASTATFVGSNGLIQSAAIDAPRFDYDPVTLAAKGLLIEEGRANLLLQSEDFATTWAVTNSSITTNATTSPAGTATADKLVENTATSTHFVNQSIASFTSGTAYSFSLYVKAAERTQLQVEHGVAAFGGTAPKATFNLSTLTVTLTGGGTSHTASITDAGLGWYRIISSLQATATAAAATNIYLMDGVGNRSYTGDGTSGLFIWGAQMETGNFPTSYIPTTTTSLTRSADVAQVNTITPWFNATEGTLYGQATVPSAVLAGRVIASLGRSTPTTSDMHVQISRAADGRRIATINETSTQFQYAPAGAVTSTKGALAYKENDSQAAFDGAASAVDTVCLVASALTTMYIGNLDSANGNLNGHIQRITYYPRRLTQAELTTITT